MRPGCAADPRDLPGPHVSEKVRARVQVHRRGPSELGGVVQSVAPHALGAGGRVQLGGRRPVACDQGPQQRARALGCAGVILVTLASSSLEFQELLNIVSPVQRLVGGDETLERCSQNHSLQHWP